METAFVFLLALSVCGASVDFSHSTMYDTKDFVGHDKVHLTKCDNGCLIFASTMGDGFIQSPTNYDPYAENLIIYYEKENRNYSITELSRNIDAKTSQKTPLIITGPASISVININSPTDSYWPLVLYVVEATEAAKFAFSVYDVRNWPVSNTVTSTGVVTVMCAYPFSLTAKSDGSANGVTARLVGFDNAKDDNVDDCPLAFTLPTKNPFDGFTLNINGPIISLIFNDSKDVRMDAELQFIPSFDLNEPGFITSGGYNGCRKPQSGGVQSFRSGLIYSSGTYMLESNTDIYNVTIDVIPNLDDKHILTIYDINNNHQETITGFNEVSKQFTNSDFIDVAYTNFAGDQGFLLRYSAVVSVVRSTTTIVSTSVPASTLPITTTTQTPTTSGSYGIEATLLSSVVAFAFTRLA